MGDGRQFKRPSSTLVERDGQQRLGPIQSLHLLPIPSAEEIAPFAVFLASDESKAVTGGIFPVDAGFIAFKSKVDTMAAMHTGEERAPTA